MDEFLDVDHVVLVIKYVLAVIYQKIHHFPRFSANRPFFCFISHTFFKYKDIFNTDTPVAFKCIDIYCCR